MRKPTAALRAAIAGTPLVQAMAAHSPLSARLVEGAGFDAVWASGFELSALYAVPDMSIVTMTQHLDMVRAMAGATTLPIIADIDTGFGNAVNVDHAVRAYERAGAAAVVIEDKSFPKVTSLVEGGRQELVSIAEFQGKIEAACAARQDRDFVVIARTEALIAGLGEEEALRRARAYAEAGADLILVHSKSKVPDEIVSFVEAWHDRAPLALVPTSYPDLDAARIAALGKVKVCIYGNHAIRACVGAMRQVFAQIRADGGVRAADRAIASVDDVFALQDMAGARTLEGRFLR